MKKDKRVKGNKKSVSKMAIALYAVVPIFIAATLYVEYTALGSWYLAGAGFLNAFRSDTVMFFSFCFWLKFSIANQGSFVKGVFCRISRGIHECPVFFEKIFVPPKPKG